MWKQASVFGVCVAGISALLLCTDLRPEQKVPLLVNYVQVGIDLGGMIRAGHPGWTGCGPYEHMPPSRWKDGQNTSESYRRCCTSVGWVAQALALRLMHAEKAWNHDAFFDYVDRWMVEDDGTFVKTIREATGRDHDKDWVRQGQARDAFVNEMWARHRPAPRGTDRWLEANARRQRLPRGHREIAIAGGR